MTEEDQLLAVGADGCRRGWVAAMAYGSEAGVTRIDLSVEDDAEGLAALVEDGEDRHPLAVDIPIGLPESTGSRQCDLEARKILGPRWMCVFSPPDRRLLECRTFEEAQQLARQRKMEDPRAIGVSRQAHNIGPKIKEVDDLMRARPDRREWIFEVHPEVSFRLLAGHDLASKKRASGRRERLALLERAFPEVSVEDAVESLPHRVKDAAIDDRLDACIALWTALRFKNKDSELVELGGQALDRYKIPMRIVA